MINGCLVTVTGSTATNTAGTALVNGKLVDVAGGQNVSVGAGGAQDRFDLVGVDNTGSARGHPRRRVARPGLPRPAAQRHHPGGGPLHGRGRQLHRQRHRQAQDPGRLAADEDPAGNDLLVNRNGSGNLFQIDGAGTTSWNDDTIIERHGVGTLRITTHLRIDDTLVVGGVITAKALVATERIIGSNLRNGSTMPSDASGHPGDSSSTTATGRLYVHQGGKWEEIATVKSAMPMGSIITSLQRPA